MKNPICRSSAILVPLAVLFVMAGCAATLPVIHSAPSREAPSPSQLSGPNEATRAAAASAGHVIVISVDGLRPDAISRFRAETIERLMEEGGYSLSAQTIVPSRTLPSHTSMLTGAQPAVHGITWNDNQVDRHGRLTVPTIFGLAHSHGLVTAAFASKGKFNHLFSPDDLDHFVVPEGDGSWSSDRTADHVSSYLDEHRPNLLFVHLREPDLYGHVFGWMGMIYGWAVRKADDAVGEILQKADETFGKGAYTVILTADHGGHGRKHGTDAASDRTIPWLAWGYGVVPGQISRDIRTTDTAATALWLLGIPLPASVSGTPVVTAFDGVALAKVHAEMTGGASRSDDFPFRP